ncbi:hypothetical protein [Streptomyces goshikiensis]|uniref:hypothetical protein n=1 Tax=Streptomyces goshikiensis TaxID=1942 RepID=UPI00371B9200
MDNEIQLISDGDGLAVIGNPTDVDRFLTSEGLSSKDLGLQRLKSVAGTGAGAAQAGSEIAADSGRWVQLTQESARLVEKYGLRESSKTGLSTAVVKGHKGQVRGFLEFVKGPRSLLTNPAALAGAARIMTQVAMQQAMDEITDYLATIDEKVDDVLRAQKDAALARAGRVSGGAARASPRAEGRPADPAGAHLAEHGTLGGQGERGRRRRQREGVAAPGQVSRRRPVEQRHRDRSP